MFAQRLSGFESDYFQRPSDRAVRCSPLPLAASPLFRPCPCRLHLQTGPATASPLVPSKFSRLLSSSDQPLLSFPPCNLQPYNQPQSSPPEPAKRNNEHANSNRKLTIPFPYVCLTFLPHSLVNHLPLHVTFHIRICLVCSPFMIHR